MKEQQEKNEKNKFGVNRLNRDEVTEATRSRDGVTRRATVRYGEGMVGGIEWVVREKALYHTAQL